MSLTANDSIEENKENVTLIWFNPNMDEDNDTEKIMEDLQAVNHFIRSFTVIDSCVTFIESIKIEKIFLILPGIHVYKLPPNIIHLSQLDSIFVFPNNPQDFKRLYEDFPKVVDICDNPNDLIISIKENIKNVNRQIEVVSFYDQHQQATRDLSEQSAEFLWFQLFKNIIQHVPDDNTAKEEMLTACRQYYRNNHRILKDINEFAENYHIDDCILWYTKDTFIYKMINKALRTEDIEQLYTYRYYIADLSKQLAENYRMLKNVYEKKIFLYRGALINTNEVEKFKGNVGKLIAVNSYWSTSRDREYALTFAKKAMYRSETVAVLYEIECDLYDDNDSVIFADISDKSVFLNEQEVLFDAGSIFQIENIKEEGDLFTIQIKTSEKGREIVKQYIEDIEEEFEYESPRIMLGVLLKRMGKWKRSLQYYKQLLQNPGEEKLSHIHNRLGIARKNQHRYDLALDHFDKAYDSACQSNPSEKVYLALIRHNQGKTYVKQNKLSEALDYYEEAVNIVRKEIGETNRYMAEFYSSIGRLHLLWEDCDKALYNQRKAIKLRESCFSRDHVIHAFSYADTAKIHSFQKKHPEALEYHLAALKIRQKYLLPDHHNTAWSLYFVGKTYYEMNNLQEARNHFVKSLEISRKCLSSSQHYILLNILHNIVLTYEKNSQETLNYRLEALDIQSNAKPINYWSLACSLDDIGFIYKSMGNQEESLNYYEKALKIREKYLYNDKFKLARLLDNLASTYKLVGRKEDSRNSYEKALKIRETYLYNDEFKLARTLNGLASIYEEVDKMKQALDCYYKIMEMCTRDYHSYHWLCKEAKRNIERIKEKLK